MRQPDLVVCPSSGAIDFKSVGIVYDVSIAPYSLRTLAIAADSSTPDSTSEFTGGSLPFFVVGCVSTTIMYSRGGKVWSDLSTNGGSAFVSYRGATDNTMLYLGAQSGNFGNDIHPEIFLCGYKTNNTSRIWMTKDDGSSWSIQDFSASCILSWIINTPGNQHWYAGGWTYATAKKSFNNGTNWEPCTMPSTEIPLNFTGSRNGTYVYAACQDIRSIVRSTNDGSTFVRVTMPGSGGTHSAVICDETGRFVMVYYYGTSVALGTHMSTDYGATFRAISGGGGGQAGLMADSSLYFFTYLVNNASLGFYWSTDTVNWTKVALPGGWVVANLNYDRYHKEIYLDRSNGATQIYKLNASRNGWDTVFTGPTNIYGALGLSDRGFRGRGIFCCVATTYNCYYIRMDGSYNKIYTGNANRYFPSVI